MGARRVAFWTLVSVTTAIYLVMVLWSLPKISAAARGATPFDMRPLGYSFEEAKTLLAALGSEGSRFYLTVQLRLDLIYPALLATTLFFAIRALAARQSVISPTLLALAAIPGADGVTPELAARASLWTCLKTGFTTVSMLLFLALSGVALRR